MADQESSIPGVPLSESMKEFDKAHGECVQSALLQLINPREPKGAVQMTEKGWRVAGYLLATMAMSAKEANLFGDGNESEELLQFGRVALDMAAWLHLNPGRRVVEVKDGQHR